MSVQDAPAENTKHSRVQRTGDMRLRGGWLVLARLAWVVVVALALLLFIISIPLNYAAAHSICTTASCNASGQLTFDQVRELHHLGLSVDFYAIFGIVLSVVFEFGYVATGVLIFWHKSDDRMALLTSFALVTFGAAFQGPSSLVTLHPVLRVLALGMAFLGNSCIGLFFYLFPTGHFAPRWIRWLAGGWIAYWGVYNLVLASINANSGPGSVAFVGLLVSMVAVQVYRYQRVSTPVQRQQTKWVVFGLSLAIVGFLVSLTVIMYFPQGIISNLVFSSLLYFFLLLIPLSIGIAILRSRLWDIDLIINRTLVYGILTVLLALLYVGLVIALQYLLRGLINQNNGVAIVASTLAIAALFQPLRQRIQRIVDRRFYRSKYDAARTVAAFSTTLRDEVDLEQLRADLLAVVQETMQPTHVSLWLRPQSDQRKQEPGETR